MFCAVVYLIFPNFNQIVNDYLFDSPMALFELVVSVWLLFKGLKPAELESSAGWCRLIFSFMIDHRT